MGEASSRAGSVGRDDASQRREGRMIHDEPAEVPGQLQPLRFPQAELEMAFQREIMTWLLDSVMARFKSIMALIVGIGVGVLF